MNATTNAERPWIAGVVLIGIGLILLAAQLFQPEEAGWIVLGGLSLLFLALFAATRARGWTIPGFILGGLAIGVALEDLGYSANGSSVVLGLAAGFIAIYVTNALTGAPAYWWPLIPGGILAVVGGSQVIGGTAAEEVVARWWPIALIVVGVLVLFGGQRQLRGSSPARAPKS